MAQRHGEGLVTGHFTHERRDLAVLVGGLDELGGVHAVLLGGHEQELQELVLLHLHLVGLGQGVEEELVAQHRGGGLADLLAVRIVRRLALLGEVGGDLGVDHALREREVHVLAEVVHELALRLGGLVLGHVPGGGGAQVLTQLVDRVELGGELGEVVVRLGEFALLHLGGRDGHLGLLARVLATLEGGGEHLLLVHGRTGEGLVQSLDHVAGAHLVGDSGDGLHLLAVNVGPQVDHHEVAVLDGAVHGHERAEALPQRGEALLHVLVRDLGRVHLEGDGGHGRELDLGAHVHLGGEHELATERALHGGNLGHVDLGLAECLHAALLHRLAVELREGLVHGLLDDGAATHTLVDDPRGDLAPAEARDVHLVRDRLVGRVDLGLQLLVGGLDGDLDPRGLEVLDGALHSVFLRIGLGDISRPVAGLGAGDGNRTRTISLEG